MFKILLKIISIKILHYYLKNISIVNGMAKFKPTLNTSRKNEGIRMAI